MALLVLVSAVPAPCEVLLAPAVYLETVVCASTNRHSHNRSHSHVVLPRCNLPPMPVTLPHYPLLPFAPLLHLLGSTHPCRPSYKLRYRLSNMFRRVLGIGGLASWVTVCLESVMPLPISQAGPSYSCWRSASWPVLRLVTGCAGGKSSSWSSPGSTGGLQMTYALSGLMRCLVVNPSPIELVRVPTLHSGAGTSGEPRWPSRMASTAKPSRPSPLTA